MSRPSVKQADLTKSEAELIGLVADLVGAMLGGRLIAYCLLDSTGVFIAPLPGAEKQVVTLLAGCDWAKMIRNAEEWTR